MIGSDITFWGSYCFNTLENGVKEDTMRMYHPYGRDAHEGIMVFAFMVHRRFFRKNMVLWCFVDRNDFDKSKSKSCPYTPDK